MGLLNWDGFLIQLGLDVLVEFLFICRPISFSGLSLDMGNFKLSRQLFNDHNGNNLTSSSEDGGLKVSQKSHGKLWYANSC